MSGSAGDHWLVRDYLCELDAAMRGLPAAQAHELKEQITAHLADALSQALEDERDLSAGYAADRAASALLVGPLRQARGTTSAAARTVLTAAAGVTAGAGYQPATVTDISALIVSLNDLSSVRANVTSSLFSASQVIRLYTGGVLAAANTFSASVGVGANDADLQGTLATLAALLGVENEMSVQRAVLFAALSSPAQRFGPGDLNTLNQAYQSQTADQADFDASTSEAVLLISAAKSAAT